MKVPYPGPMCGDRMAHELEHANTPLHDCSDWPLPSFDAQDWAKAFIKAATENKWLDKIDEEIMVTWFANALMRGYDEGTARVADKEG